MSPSGALSGRCVSNYFYFIINILYLLFYFYCIGNVENTINC